MSSLARSATITIVVALTMGCKEDGATDPSGTPSIVIASITKTGAGGASTPIDPNNVTGTVRVTVAADPGAQTFDRAVVVIEQDTISQASEANALASFSAEAALAAVPIEITLSVNTAEITNLTTGAVRFTNGPKTLKAVLFTRAPGSSNVVVTESVSQNIILLNQSGFLGKLTLVGSTGPATDQVNATWKKGGLQVDATPVLYGSTAAPYTVPTITSARVTVGNAACSAGGERTQIMNQVGAVFAALFNSDELIAAPTNVVGYEFQPTRCGADPGQPNAQAFRFGEVPSITAIGSDGNPIELANTGSLAGGRGFLNDPIFTGATGIENPFAIRLDNLGPNTAAANIALLSPQGDATPPIVNAAYGTRICSPAPAAIVPPYCPGNAKPMTLDVGDRSNGWLNDAVRLAAAYVDSERDAPYAAVDFGVSRQVGTVTNRVGFFTRVGPATSPAAAIDASAPVADLLGFPQFGQHQLKVRATVSDGLSNTTFVGETLAGLDRVIPQTTFQPNELIVSTVLNVGTIGTAAFNATISDPVVGGVSSAFLDPEALYTILGFTQLAGGTPIKTYLCPSDAAATSGTFVAQNATCPTWISGNQFKSNRNVRFFATTEGYLEVTSTSADQAGNTSLPATAIGLYDVTPPGVIFNLPTTLSGSATTTFNIDLTDNVEVGAASLAINYSGVGIYEYPVVSIGTFGPPLLAQGSAAFAINLLTNLQTVTGGGNPILPGSLPNLALGRGRDAGGNFGTSVQRTITPSLLPAPVPFQPAAFTMATGAGGTEVSRDGTTPGVPQTITVSGSVTGAWVGGVPFPNPLQRMEFWSEVGPNSFRFIGTATTPTFSDNPGQTARTWTYSTLWNPDSFTAFGAPALFNFLGTGVSSAGNAVQIKSATPINVRP